MTRGPRVKSSPRSALPTTSPSSRQRPSRLADEASAKVRRTRLVHAGNFLRASRDSGYRSTAYAVAELVDNAIQASASRVSIKVWSSGIPEYPVEVVVVDNGDGMDVPTLSSALAFGGTTRFGDRVSLGRYGMGLPCGSLSLARRVEVYTWTPRQVLMTYIDLDEFSAQGRGTLPGVEWVECPSFVPHTRRGTAVRLSRCDRIEHRRVSTVVRKLGEELGRIYRRFLAGGLRIDVNGDPVAAHDPLFLNAEAAQFGDTLTYKLNNAGLHGRVEVRFSELPVGRWHDLEAGEKRQLGITNGAAVSVLRAGREIDRGWFFMGKKRRENYDDWWRCELSFEPALDEMFGVTHTKQAIAPTVELLQFLEPDLEPIARALNKRVRQAFDVVKAAKALSPAERQAARAEPSLPPLPRRPAPLPQALRSVVEALPRHGTDGACPYRLVVADLPTTDAFEVVVRDGQLLVLVNAGHPLYRDLCGPLTSSDLEKDQTVGKHVMLTILAAARAEVAESEARPAELRRFRETWSDVVATFFNA